MKKSELKQIIREVIEEGRKVTNLSTLIKKYKKIAQEQSEIRKEKGELEALVNASKKGYQNILSELLRDIREWDKPEDKSLKNDFLKKYYPSAVTEESTDLRDYSEVDQDDLDSYGSDYLDDDTDEKYDGLEVYRSSRPLMFTGEIKDKIRSLKQKYSGIFIDSKVYEDNDVGDYIYIENKGDDNINIIISDLKQMFPSFDVINYGLDRILINYLPSSKTVQESVKLSRKKSIIEGDVVVHIPNNKIAIVIDVFPEDGVIRIDTDGVVDEDEVRLASPKDMDNMKLKLGESTIKRISKVGDGKTHKKLLDGVQAR